MKDLKGNNKKLQKKHGNADYLIESKTGRVLVNKEKTLADFLDWCVVEVKDAK